MFFCLQADALSSKPVLSFDVLYIQIFITKYIHILKWGHSSVYLKYDVKFTDLTSIIVV